MSLPSWLRRAVESTRCQALRRLSLEELESRLAPDAKLFWIYANEPTQLQQAILDANANPGKDTIAFINSGRSAPYFIRPGSLPEITDALVIDGGLRFPGDNNSDPRAFVILLSYAEELQRAELKKLVTYKGAVTWEDYSNQSHEFHISTANSKPSLNSSLWPC